MISRDVMEHVAPNTLGAIFRESARVLSPRGVACHIIDESDHWQHGDTSITRVNFLRFSDIQHRLTYLNSLNYHNPYAARSTSNSSSVPGSASCASNMKSIKRVSPRCQICLYPQRFAISIQKILPQRGLASWLPRRKELTALENTFQFAAGTRHRTRTLASNQTASDC